MYRKHKYDIIILLSLIGFGVSVYLMASELLGFNVPCSLTQGCNEVLQSKYARLLGLPLPVWGIAFYFGVVFFSLLANHYKQGKKLLTLLLSVGSLGALAFLFIQFFVIGKVCQYCLVTDVLAIALLLLDINIEHGHPLDVV